MPPPRTGRRWRRRAGTEERAGTRSGSPCPDLRLAGYNEPRMSATGRGDMHERGSIEYSRADDTADALCSPAPRRDERPMTTADRGEARSDRGAAAGSAGVRPARALRLSGERSLRYRDERSRFPRRVRAAASGPRHFRASYFGLLFALTDLLGRDVDLVETGAILQSLPPRAIANDRVLLLQLEALQTSVPTCGKPAIDWPISSRARPSWIIRPTRCYGPRSSDS